MKKMRRYRRPKSKIQNRIKITVVLCAIALFVVFAHRNITRVLISVADASMQSVATGAINEAVYNTISDNVQYDELVNVVRGGNAEIIAITANSLQINQLARKVVANSQENLKAKSLDGIQVPIGAFFGLETLSGFGPKVTIKIIPVSNVNCVFSSKFVSAGINQTKHSIYLEVVAEVSIVMSTKSSNFTTYSQVLICESILVGKVPDRYLQSDIFS